MTKYHYFYSDELHTKYSKKRFLDPVQIGIVVVGDLLPVELHLLVDEVPYNIVIGQDVPVLRRHLDTSFSYNNKDYCLYLLIIQLSTITCVIGSLAVPDKAAGQEVIWVQGPAGQVSGEAESQSCPIPRMEKNRKQLGVRKSSN